MTMNVQQKIVQSLQMLKEESERGRYQSGCQVLNLQGQPC
jgi:hypothetical protein